MGKKDLSRQKKFDTRIDFTPMVDMNMLLITFFMLCTTMLKSQTLSLVIPAKSENQEQQEEAKQSEAVTIIIDGEAAFNDRGEYISDADKTKFYVYEGMLDDNVEIKEAELNGKDESTIRNIIFRKNQKAYEKIEEEIAKKDKGEGIYQNEATRDSLFNEKVKEIGNNEDLKQATVMIKPTGRAGYRAVVAALDEMQIMHVSRWRLQSLTKEDSLGLEKIGVKLPPAPAR